MNKSIKQSPYVSPQQFIEIDEKKILEYSIVILGLFGVGLIGSILYGLTNLFMYAKDQIKIFNFYYLLAGLVGVIVIIGIFGGSIFGFIMQKAKTKEKILFILLLFIITILSAVFAYSLTLIKYSKNINSYEGFTNETITIEKIKQKTIELQKALDSLEIMDEETCNILNNIESKFMDNATVPQSDESNLSETTKQSMKTRRIEKAKNDWKTKKQDYETKTKQYGSTKIMECFEDQKDEEYNEALNELYNLLNSPSVSNIDLKINKMNITNDFSLMYADKFAKEASDALAKKEGFENGSENRLENKVEKNPSELIKQANNIIQKIEQSKTILEKTKRSSNAINNMTSNANTIANIVSN
jgi:hypothetical protein